MLPNVFCGLPEADLRPARRCLTLCPIRCVKSAWMFPPPECQTWRSYRDALPQLDGSVFLMDGGLETTLVFLEGLDLPCFAAFPLLLDDAGRQTLKRYFEPYLRTAADREVGFVLDTATWRANSDWGEKLGFRKKRSPTSTVERWPWRLRLGMHRPPARHRL